MSKFSIKKQVGFAAAAISSCAVLALTVGVGLLMNQNNAEAAPCTGADCSNLKIEKAMIGTDGSTDVATDSEFQYTIKVAADKDVSGVEVTDQLSSNVQYKRLQSVDLSGGSARTVSANYSGNNLVLGIGDLASGQEITLTILAKATQLPNYSATTVNSTAFVYGTNDTQCKTLSSAQSYGDSCSSSVNFSIISARLQIDKTINGNYVELDTPIHTGEEFLYTLTVTNNALGTYARDTITVYDEIDPHLSNVRIEKIIYFNKLVEGFDDNNNLVDADPPYCTISSQTMKCTFDALLYDETTSGNQILIQVAATPSAQYVVPDNGGAYQINNKAYVYSQSDSYCKTLDKAKESLDSSNRQYIEISDGKGGVRSRCNSEITFSVVQPQLEITKSIKDNRDGKVWCTYRLSGYDGDDYKYDPAGNITYDPNNYVRTKDITNEVDKEAACINEDAAYRKPTDTETQTAWLALSDDEKRDVWGWSKDGGAGNAAAYQSFKTAYQNDKANEILVSGGTLGTITDNSVRNGETLIYVLEVKNTGNGDTKGDVVVTDQLDKNAFSDAGVSIQPLTGGVECSVKDLLVTCVISRVLSNKEESGQNTVIIQIAATIEGAGTIYNSAFVGGGSDLKCPISENGTMWCKSNEVSTYVTSPELHINKELRIDEKDCPTDGSSSSESEGDADPCWSLGTTIVEGSWAKYVIKVTNEGTANTEGLVVIHDQIPEYLEVDRTTLALKFDDGAYSYTAGLCEFRGTSNRDLYCRAYDTMEGGLQAKNGVWTVEFNVRVLQDADINKDNNKVINYAYVYGGGDAVCTNETIELSVQEAFKNGTNSPLDRCYDYLGSTIVSPKLNVQKTISSGQVQAGEPFKYTISVDNIGNDDMPFGTKMVDILPADITIDTTSLPAGCEYNDGSRRITCTINEKISKNRPMIFELTATTTNATGTIVNKALAYNKYDKDCQTELAAGYTSRCHDSAVAQSLSPVLKVNVATNVLDTYVGGQVEYRIVVKNIGNMATTETTTINQAIPEGLRVLGVRAQKGQCWPSATEIKCEIPAGVQAGETVNISVLAQATSEGDIVSDVNLYDGGDETCSVDGSETTTTSWLTTPVFAADTPSDVADGTEDESKTSDSNSDSTAAETTTENETSSESSEGGSLPATVTTPQATESTAVKRDSRCQDSVTIRSYASTSGVLGINDSGINSPMAGALSMLQAVGTVTLLGAASYGLLKFGFVATPVK